MFDENEIKHIENALKLYTFDIECKRREAQNPKHGAVQLIKRIKVEGIMSKLFKKPLNDVEPLKLYDTGDSDEIAKLKNQVAELKDKLFECRIHIIEAGNKCDEKHFAMSGQKIIENTERALRFLDVIDNSNVKLLKNDSP